MGLRCVLSFLLAASSLASGCNPYERRTGEFLAGSVDPAHFPQEYLGEGGSGSRPGNGVFIPITAKAKGKDLLYYMFPLPAAQDGLDEPLLLGNLAPALAYSFDPGAMKPGCVPPQGYKYDPRTDAVHYDQQGAIFTQLPDATDTYVPIVAQVKVTSNGEPCQDIKSEETLLTRTDVTVAKKPPAADVPDAKPTGVPDSPPRYLVWPIIDPTSRVLGPDESWGFYNHYLLAYLDGGSVPTQTGMGMPCPSSGDCYLVAQDLYYPTLMNAKDKQGMDVVVPGKPGAGHDVLDAVRGDTAYSPLCRVFSYEPMIDPMTSKPIEVDDVMKIKSGMLKVMDTGTIIYCVQLP